MGTSGIKIFIFLLIIASFLINLFLVPTDYKSFGLWLIMSMILFLVMIALSPDVKGKLKKMDDIVPKPKKKRSMLKKMRNIFGSSKKSNKPVRTEDVKDEEDVNNKPAKAEDVKDEENVNNKAAKAEDVDVDVDVNVDDDENMTENVNDDDSNSKSNNRKFPKIFSKFSGFSFRRWQIPETFSKIKQKMSGLVLFKPKQNVESSTTQPKNTQNTGKCDDEERPKIVNFFFVLNVFIFVCLFVTIDTNEKKSSSQMIMILSVIIAICSALVASVVRFCSYKFDAICPYYSILNIAIIDFLFFCTFLIFYFGNHNTNELFLLVRGLSIVVCALYIDITRDKKKHVVIYIISILSLILTIVLILVGVDLSVEAVEPRIVKLVLREGKDGQNMYYVKDNKAAHMSKTGNNNKTDNIEADLNKELYKGNIKNGGDLFDCSEHGCKAALNSKTGHEFTLTNDHISADQKINYDMWVMEWDGVVLSDFESD